jgi:hypothetical protein
MKDVGNAMRLRVGLLISAFAAGCFSDAVNGVVITGHSEEFLFAGDTSRFVALAFSDPGFLQGRIKFRSDDMQGRFSWASTNPAVATVDAHGLVTALSRGVTQLTARVDGHQNHPLPIHVTPPATSLSAEPRSIHVTLGDTVVLQVQALTGTGGSVTGVPFGVSPNDQFWTVLRPLDATRMFAPYGSRFVAMTIGQVVLTARSVNRRMDRLLTAPAVTIDVVPRP